MAQTQGNFISALAGADLHTSAHLIAKLDTNGKAVLAAAATDDIVGVIEESQQAGSGVSTSGGGVSIAHISGSGTGEVIAGASGISKGAYLTSDSNGKAVTASQTAGGTAPSVRVFGRARVAANAGDLFEYEKIFLLY
jgi:hypothetical protein